MQFVKLRLVGFKSFVEPTEISIETGLTGIVGPNGCGKSNLIEALRWVMGETSARNMRGSEMEDVIFSGSARRPPRSLAEVCVSLENTARDAPAMFNQSDDIEVRRRIERGVGSTYRVNGAEVRARDVQLLFADATTGSRSTAIVSQGRVGEIIAAKPGVRRTIIEEAAGITGLYSRRHEAELRLRGAETNLERLDDVLAGLSAQRQNLERQARQAIRYRTIGDHIRKTRSLMLAQQWQDAQNRHHEGQNRLKEWSQKVTEYSADVAAATTRQLDITADLPRLREVKATADGHWQRLRVERDQIAAEEDRLSKESQERITQLEDIRADIDRETSFRDEATDALKKCAQEEEQLRHSGPDSNEAELQADLEQAKKRLDTYEKETDTWARKVADNQARQTSLCEIRDANQIRLKEIDQICAENQDSEDSDPQKEETDLSILARKVDDARMKSEHCNQEVDRQSSKTAAAQEDLEKKRSTITALTASLSAMEAEENALASLLESGIQGQDNPASESITVSPGYEAAIATAFGEGLTAPICDDGPAGWRHVPPLEDPPSWPDAVRPLSELVEVPAVLQRRLALIGLVNDHQQARRLQKQLAPGQCLVSSEGCLWRWDGYSIQTASETSAARRLRQRHRLTELRNHLDAERRRHHAAETAFQEARKAVDQEQQIQEKARDNQRQTLAILEKARTDQTAAMVREAARVSQLAKYDAMRREAEKLEAENARLQQQLRELDGIEQDQKQLSEKRSQTETQRHQVMRIQRILDDLLHKNQSRDARLATLSDEKDRWQQRLEESQSHRQRLKERETDIRQKLEAATSQPDQRESKKQNIDAALLESEAERRRADCALAEAEDDRVAVEKLLKDQQDALHQARESRIRCEVEIQHVADQLDHLATRIDEKLGWSPAELLRNIAESPANQEPPEKTEARLERLLRERDALGAVNLRAEQEAAEITQQWDTMSKERDDLLSAIARLRSGITNLNREGRQRFLSAFGDVNNHFRDLFTRLFGGGKAYIALVDAEDPLEAGLEIYASPPGKKLQTLTLLSGGEQALTAVALLFAVFLTNPAPVCVLDEVDAPLDDANVDRFCDLIEDIAAKTRTRFLLVTHHRLTMARVHRLYGVTMSEQGVSRIVSVDMQHADTGSMMVQQPVDNAPSVKPVRST